MKAGRVSNVATPKAGTQVTVTASIVEGTAPASSIQDASVKYFVHSKHPVDYHVGFAYADSSDFDFEAVRALEGRDLFAEVTKDDADADLVAFMSYEFRSSRTDETGSKSGWAVTLGTDLEDVGERLYLGLSYRFMKRWYVTAGASSVEVTEGEGMVMEMAEDATPTGRELFESLSKEREWEGFVGVSIRLF